MDPELMQLMARFKLRMRRALDQTVDTYRFLDDREYALATLKIADESDDEDLIVMSMRVADQIGLMPSSSATPAKQVKQAAPVAPKEEAPKSRYMYGARG
jgi:hypothetical protein